MREEASGSASATLDDLARSFAQGQLSRRQALGGLVSAVAGAWVLRPARAWGIVRPKCPSSHRCGDDCCRHGERCRSHKGHHRCVCKPGLKRCHGKCVNTNRDVHNCGACGNECGGSQVCSHGTCTTRCATGETNCNGSCVDVQTDADNCGGCGNVCAGNATAVSCAAGTCSYTCAWGFADCNTTLPNLDGCETPITTTQNCGGCGNTCGSSHVQSATCAAGIKCSYTCSAGYSNCNQSGANTGGCECATPGCCGSSCQVTHSNGVGQNYFSCDPLGTPGTASTYTLAMAQGARAVWNAGSDSTGVCGGSSNTVSRVTATQCAVWAYSGTLAGRVFISTPAECFCPLVTDPTWN